MSDDNELLKELGVKLNVIMALLLAIGGDSSHSQLLKKRKANKELVEYFGDTFGLSNKDMAKIFNTTESGISNLKSKKKK